jgi:hypothetical protein
MGNLFFTVISLRPLKSTPNLHDLSFFLTRMIGEEYGLVLRRIIDFCNISLIGSSTEFFWLWDMRYGLIFGGLAPSLKGMWWSQSLCGGRPVGYWNMSWN